MWLKAPSEFSEYSKCLPHEQKFACRPSICRNRISIIMWFLMTINMSWFITVYLYWWLYAINFLITYPHCCLWVCLKKKFCQIWRFIIIKHIKSSCAHVGIFTLFRQNERSCFWLYIPSCPIQQWWLKKRLSYAPQHHFWPQTLAIRLCVYVLYIYIYIFMCPLSHISYVYIYI